MIISKRIGRILTIGTRKRGNKQAKQTWGIANSILYKIRRKHRIDHRNGKNERIIDNPTMLSTEQPRTVDSTPQFPIEARFVWKERLFDHSTTTSKTMYVFEFTLFGPFIMVHGLQKESKPTE